MKISNNEIMIQRGETFAISKTIENKDGSPYIVSSQLNNPFLLISIASSKFEQSSKFIMNYYMNLSKIPRFLFTNPININDLYYAEAGGEDTAYTDWPELLAVNDEEDTTIFHAYYKGDYVVFQLNDAVFCKVNDDRVEYKYVVREGGNYVWKDYAFKFVKQFNGTDTAKLTAQTYYYSIQIVFGPLVEDWHDTSDPLGFVNGRYVGPLQMIEGSLPILPPTKLSVLSNLVR